jgi:IclR family acetate operon transcriptional repressor
MFHILKQLRGTLSSLERGLQVLESLGERRELRLIEVAVLLQVSRPTAFRLLATLEAKGYVEHARGEHRLGQAVLVLAARAEAESVVRLAEPALSDLRALSGETANLALVHRTTIVYAAILDGVHTLRMSAKIGEKLPPHATALGKAVLSRLPPRVIVNFVGQEPFRRYTPNTILGRDRLAAELEQVRRRGYATDDEECETGASCVACAVIGLDGSPVGGISVSGLAARMSPQVRADLGETVRSWCERVSEQLGDSRTLARRSGERMTAT